LLLLRRSAAHRRGGVLKPTNIATPTSDHRR
jgi:hypothetical protein